MSNFTAVKREFHKLSSKEQEALLRDMYTFSKDTRLFLEGKLLEGDAAAQAFIRDMERETIGKIYRHGMPDVPKVAMVNSILSKAQKSDIGLNAMMTLEQLAYRGFIEFLNEFGGGPENFEEQACNHLEAYLRLVRESRLPQDGCERIYQEVKKYLHAKNNMITDTLFDTYYEVIGENI